MDKTAFLAVFYSQFRRGKSAMTAFSLLSVIIITLFSFLSVKAAFDSSEFFESLGLIIWLMIGLAATNLSADVGVMDFSGRTGLLVLSQPVDRKTIITARLLACFSLMLLPLLILYLSGFLSGFALYRMYMPDALLSLGFAFLYALSFISFIVGVSSASKEKSTPLSTGLTFSLLAVFVFAVFGKFIGIEPWFFLPYAGLIISSTITVPHPLHVNPGNYFFYYMPYAYEAAIIMLVYTAIFISIAFFNYSRREVI